MNGDVVQDEGGDGNALNALVDFLGKILFPWLNRSNFVLKTLLIFVITIDLEIVDPIDVENLNPIEEGKEILSK